MLENHKEQLTHHFRVLFLSIITIIYNIGVVDVNLNVPESNNNVVGP
jgi:hypothetical protein